MEYIQIVNLYIDSTVLEKCRPDYLSKRPQKAVSGGGLPASLLFDMMGKQYLAPDRAHYAGWGRCAHEGLAVAEMAR
ncbi:MAG: hypothetical protein VB099_11530 [Candidatus Limiplasma sp.]|nr:hypothetical protein [Candidatus Limiplasma sp.]